MKRGFTLVELMVVIAVIGILAASLFPVTTQYLSRARDTGKVSELNQLQTAIEAYHVDKETYFLSGAGSSGGGQGWINYSGPTYPSSLFAELKRMGYMDKVSKQKTATDLSLPQIKNNKPPCAVLGTGGGSDLYMFYFNDSLDRYSIAAHLENPKDKDIDNIQISYNGIGANGTCTRYGRNYSVGK